MAPVRFTLQGASHSGMISQVHQRVLKSSFAVPTNMCALTYRQWKASAVSCFLISGDILPNKLRHRDYLLPGFLPRLSGFS